MEQTEVMVDNNVKTESGFAGRLISIIFEPKKVFESIKIRPMILIQMIFIIIALTIVTIPKASITLEYSKQTLQKIFSSEKFQKTQNISKDSAEKIIDSQMKLAKWVVYPQAVLGPLFILLIGAGVFYGVFKAIGGTAKFGETFGVFLYAYFINIIGEIVRTVSVVLTHNYESTNSLALLMTNDKTNFLYNLFSLLDIFSIWSIIIIAYGLSIIHNVSKNKSLKWTLSVWFITILAVAAYTTMQAAILYKQYGITI